MLRSFSLSFLYLQSACADLSATPNPARTLASGSWRMYAPSHTCSFFIEQFG